MGNMGGGGREGGGGPLPALPRALGVGLPRAQGVGITGTTGVSLGGGPVGGGGGVRVRAELKLAEKGKEFTLDRPPLLRGDVAPKVRLLPSKVFATELFAFPFNNAFCSESLK